MNCHPVGWRRGDLEAERGKVRRGSSSEQGERSYGHGGHREDERKRHRHSFDAARSRDGGDWTGHQIVGYPAQLSCDIADVLPAPLAILLEAAPE